jgi:periplasmic protein TonB
MSNYNTGDMLEIIFAHRNKAYGAYQLRRSYHKTLMRAFALGVSFIAFLFIMPRFANALSGVMVERPDETEVTMSAPPDLTPEVPLTPPPPPVTPPPPARTTFVFVPPVILEDPMAPDKITTEVDELLEKEGVVGTKEVQGTTDIAPTIDPGDDLGDVVEAPKKVILDKVYDSFDIQKMPSFPGGDAAMMAYLRENIIYPTIAKETNIMGTVALRFVVGVDGSISDIAILKDPGGGCGKEAVRVLKSMPTWIPGEANGNPVKVRFTMPVRFILQ